MKNIQGTKKNLKLYYKNGKLAYWFNKGSNGYSSESTYDKNGKQVAFKNNDGYSYKRTHDKQGNELTFKNSDGVMRAFDTKK